MRHDSERRARRHLHGATFGMILILVGLVSLVSYWFDITWALVFFIGLGLCAWGVYRRTSAGIIPGGVLSGIGAAIVLLEGPWNINLPESQQTGLFLICFAMGWFMITACMYWATQTWIWWPLVPGTLMAVIGGLSWLQPEWVQIFSTLGIPLLLVLIGVIIIIRGNRNE